jgi:plasmid stability protein
MGRPSKLSESEWQEVLRRALAGENVRGLAREYGIAEGAIRQRVKTQKETIVSSANQIVSAERKISELPIYAQSVAFDYLSALRAITNDLSRAAATGASNAARLQALAAVQLDRVSADPEVIDVEALKTVNAVTQTANLAAKLGVDLIAANKGNEPIGQTEAPKLKDISPANAAKAYAAFIGK